MGQEVSVHDKFISGLKESLQIRRVKVKKKDLVIFFNFLKDVCPWLPQEGTIDHKRWKRVGDALNDFYKTFGPEKIPITAFTYWNCINELLMVDRYTPDIYRVLQEGNTFLQNASRPSSSLQDPSSKSSHDSDSISISMPPEDPETTKKHPSKPLYPPLPPNCPDLNVNSSPPEDDQLSPEDEADLEEAAAKYHNPDWQFLASNQLPPPYNPQMPLAPIHDPDQTLLSHQVQQLQRTVQLKKQHLTLLKQLQQLDLQLSSAATQKTPPLSINPTKKFPISNKKPPLNLFPVIEFPPIKTEGGSADSDEDPDRDNKEPARHYKRLDLKTTKELKKAVDEYGPTAPFTLSILQSLDDLWLTTHDWHYLAHATLSGGDYVLWKSEFSEACKETARRNAEAGGECTDWTYDKLRGFKPYDTNEAQLQYPSGLFSQIHLAATKAWKKLLPKGPATTQLTSIRQRPDEPYADFISRLTNATERLLGSTETDSDFFKQLAFENANSACQAAIRPRKKGSLSDYIRLCTDIGPGHQMGLAIGAALKDFRLNLSKGKNNCFSCGQPRHFAKQCPTPRQTPLGQPTPTPILPPRVCPRCKRGKHWANQCRSKIDAHGNPLLPQQGNFLRGQPQAPTENPNLGATRFAHPQQNFVPSQVSSEQPPAVQDWTSVPPPNQY